MKSTSTDEGVKPERVNKMDGKERGDEKKSPQPVHIHDVICSMHHCIAQAQHMS